QAKKLYIGNVCGFGAMTCPPENYTVKLNTGQVDPALGMSYVQFAMDGLRHQLSQGAGGWSVEPGDRFTFYKLVDSVLAKTTDKDGHEKDFVSQVEQAALSTQRDPPVAVSPGQRINERFTFHNGSGDSLRIDYFQMRDVATNTISPSRMLVPPHQDYSQEFHLQVPESLCCTRPYWHRQNPETDSVNAIDEPQYATLPFPPFPLQED